MKDETSFMTGKNGSLPLTVFCVKQREKPRDLNLLATTWRLSEDKMRNLR